MGIKDDLTPVPSPTERVSDLPQTQRSMYDWGAGLISKPDRLVWNSRTQKWYHEDVGTTWTEEGELSDYANREVPANSSDLWNRMVLPYLSDYILNKLARDPSTRQAFLSMGVAPQHPSPPCFTGMQGLIRGDTLIMIYTMRSSNESELEDDKKFMRYVTKYVADLLAPGLNLRRVKIVCFKGSDHREVRP